MKIAKSYEIIHGVASDPRVKLRTTMNQYFPSMQPVMIAIILDRARIDATGEIEHHKSVFIDDRMHDWSFNSNTGEIRYYSHGVGSAIMAEACGDEVDRADIIVIYEFEK